MAYSTTCFVPPAHKAGFKLLVDTYKGSYTELGTSKNDSIFCRVTFNWASDRNEFKLDWVEYEFATGIKKRGFFNKIVRIFME